MYGTQDASNIWHDDYTELLAQNKYKRGASNAAVPFNEEEDARVLVHGDKCRSQALVLTLVYDIVVSGPHEAVDRFEQILDRAHEYRKLANFGFDEKDRKGPTFLNRVITLIDGRPRKPEVEADRHAEIIVNELEAPAAKPSAEQQMTNSK
jgi:hypothetical protein